MDRYRILESVGPGTQPVRSYEDLEIHHPTANRRGIATGQLEHFENPRKRDYARVDGDFEEIRREADGRVLVKKDFILVRGGPGPVHVPSPVDGYVHYLRDGTAAVRIYDRPKDEPGARLLAQSLHMDPASFRIPEGGRVAYGQLLGRMSDTGSPGSIHAHVEAEPEQFRRYIRDIADGTIAPGRWPGKGRAADDEGAAPSRQSHVASREHPARPSALGVLDAGDRSPDVLALQQRLNQLGVRDAQGLPLREDGDFGRRTREAIEDFQREHGLAVDGRVGGDTRAALARPHGARITAPNHPDYPIFEQVLRRLHDAHDARGDAPDARSTNVAAALVLRMREAGIERADRVEFNDTGRLVRVVQASPSGFREHERATLPIDTSEAVQQSLHATSDRLAELRHEREPGGAETLTTEQRVHAPAR